MNTEDNRHIDELIGNVLADDVPAEVDRRLRTQLETFRSALGEVNKSSVRPPRTLGRRVWFGASAAAAATIAAVLIWWSLLPGVSLADVATAVLKQPWIHVAETDPSGGRNELWYSPVKDVSAWHDKDWIEYRDHQLRVYYAYDIQGKVLYRVPEEMRRSMEQFAAVIASLRILLETKQPPDNPLEHLGFPENEQTRYEVVKQDLRKVKRDDREWLDYHLTVKGHGHNMAEPIQSQVLFRVDCETKLLRLVRFEYDWKGKRVVAEHSVEYPEKGPADVYDLGVPKTAKLVDRVPNNDLARILETLRAGRQRMDNYRAVLVHRMEGSWRPSSRLPDIISRKGEKFRRDTAMWNNPSAWSDPKTKWPEANKDAVQWWNKYIKDHCFLLPVSIDRGLIEWTTKCRDVTDPDGSVHMEITAVEKHAGAGPDCPSLWSEMPEFACRPPMGIPHETLEAVLEPNPKEGPAGTILLHVRHVGPKQPWTARDSEGKLLAAHRCMARLA